MVEFARRWPDMLLWSINRAKTAPFVIAGTIKVSAERDEGLTSQVVIDATPAQLETAVSRQFIIAIDTYAANKSAALNLWGDIAFTIGDSLRQGPFIRLVGQSGPNLDRDDAGAYYATGTVTITAGPA